MAGVAFAPGWRLLGSVFAPSRRFGRLSVLIYHRVLQAPDPLFPEIPVAATFRWQMEALRSTFSVLPLKEAIGHAAKGTLPARAACVTFDDGYADNAEVALPILESLGLPATFFVATGFLDGGRMFNDTVIEAVRAARRPLLDLDAIGIGRVPVGNETEKRAAISTLLSAVKYLPIAVRLERVARIAEAAEAELPPSPMMTAAQVKRIADAGMEIGAHTVNHPILTQLDEVEAGTEIRDGKARLEALIERPVELFAYPNGRPGKDYDARHLKILAELGFTGAVSTAAGVATRSCDSFQIPRFTPWDRTPGRFVARLLQNCLHGRPETI